MSIDKEFVLDALLRHNYLPTQRKSSEELPPVFNSCRFTKEVAEELNSLASRQGGYDQVEYRLTRFNNVYRLLTIPHPLPHAKLCLTICSNWESIDYISDNPNSHIKPKRHADGRLMVMDYEPTISKSLHQIAESFGKRFKVHTDITNCFPSIYSHAIPWALVGFDVAKTKKPPKYKDEWFNQVDEMLRLTKRNETQGVAIGPATSNILSEIILARIDEKLREKFTYFRNIDDYTCHCDSEEDAQEFIRQLSLELSEFKLLLNIKKTEVIRLPEAISSSWVMELSTRIPDGAEISPYQAIQFIDFAVALSKRHPEGSVLKFAFKSLLNKKLDFFSSLDVLRYGMVLSFHNPVLLPLFENMLKEAWILPETHGQLNRIVQENARLYRSDGMCWGLYLLFQASAQVEEKTATAVLNTGDVLSILMLYYTGQHTDKVVAFCKGLNKEDSYALDCYWLLLYQVYLEGSIDNPYSDGVFEIMKQHGVTFFSPTGKEDCVLLDFKKLLTSDGKS